MATIKSEAARLETTVSLLETNLEKKSTSGASVKISGWIKVLNERTGLKTIARDLEKLKKAIAEKDGAKICMLLEKLGDATIAAADKAANADTPAVKNLGKGLLKASKIIKAFVA